MNQFYVPFQSLRIIEDAGEKFIESTVLVNLHEGEYIEISEDVVYDDPVYRLHLAVMGVPRSLNGYIWVGRKSSMSAEDPAKWYYVTSQVYQSDQMVASSSNTIHGGGGTL
jgi:hypothetical protein